MCIKPPAIEAKRTGQVSAMKAKLVAMIDSKDAASIKTVLQEAIQVGYSIIMLLYYCIVI
jgi:hypothetical protein